MVTPDAFGLNIEQLHLSIFVGHADTDRHRLKNSFQAFARCQGALGSQI